MKLEVKVSRHLPNTTFDGSQMRLVVKHLLENAAYFATERAKDFARVSVLVSHNKHSKQDVIEIRDNGYGVGLDHIDHIFEPFYSSEPGHSGLGLYLAKQFCEMNMARLDYIANQEGACFRITFASPIEVERFLEKREAFDIRDKLRTSAA